MCIHLSADAISLLLNTIIGVIFLYSQRAVNLSIIKAFGAGTDNEEMMKSLSTFATGGLSREVIAHCKTSIIYNENLLLEGLRVIYEKNHQ